LILIIEGYDDEYKKMLLESIKEKHGYI